MGFLDSDPQRDRETLQGHVTKLRRHFDTVQVFATRHDPETDETYSFNWGEGNWNARVGQVALWLDGVEARNKHNAILPDDDEDDD